jgi:hemolysin III
VSHQIAFFVALVGTASLAHAARSGTQTQCALVFGASLVALFGISALYHRVNWQPAARQRMRRLDHSAIFILIAGGYTPLLGLVPSTSGGHGALAVVWIGAALGVVKSLVWPHAPKWLTALLCVGLGWIGVGEVIDRVSAVGSSTIAPLVASGAVYSAGAIVYALKRPNPSPRIFGYHEVFHALVIAASALLFGHVALVLRVT